MINPPTLELIGFYSTISNHSQLKINVVVLQGNRFTEAVLLKGPQHIMLE